MASYKTPGVYVEEIVKFPPSVAQVETAIPAFIGYTETAKKKIKDDLIMEPVRITSLLEYVSYFGRAHQETTISVDILNAGKASEEIIVSQPSSPSPFGMYYHLQMYFANGGGPCFIVSTGTYETALANNSSDPVILQEVGGNGAMGLNDGLTKIRAVDEVTLIVFPDATSLPAAGDFYGLYKNALIQCKELQDRFTIIDTYENSQAGVDVLRNSIDLGKNFLKYGAAYYPYVDTILDFAYDESTVIVNGIDGEDVGTLATTVKNGIDVDVLETILTDVKTSKDDIAGAANKTAAIALKGTAILNVNKAIDYLKNQAAALNNLIDNAIKLNDTDTTVAANALSAWVDTDIEAKISDLLGLVFKLDQDDTKAKLSASMTGVETALGLNATITDSTIYVKLNKLKTEHADEPQLKDLIAELPAGSAKPTLEDLNDASHSSYHNGRYNQIKTEIGLMPIKLPPSATIAGVYARVDSDRGVWKAPANVGLNYVTKPTIQVTHEEQQNFNVDTVAGKSINVIRAFVGKGNLVWGARTLAGNDNEWRYVSVRRFFNMAEESIKKASEQFVFEPNDRNTWVRVKAMIDNFLTLQWRAGALAGPTPESAFYVKVGLGETMTAQDILEGNMILEIGMAVVRPAEFIILKFSHKMQEA